ncbi:unnamed protein product [Hydatigera taeniaeformis]|uniref:Glycos_transf_1 domain-containing protein n=1 Tax=Hydatigena taeniaeformis TaxID=6205 RepID=A0A0R3WJ76_HYDTA|nr:unnamed protein product [Hydatigera taeniaeformis]
MGLKAEEEENGCKPSTASSVVHNFSSLVLASPPPRQCLSTSLFINIPSLVDEVSKAVLVNRFDAADIKGVIAMVESQLDTRLDNFILLVGRLRPLKDPNYILQPFLEVVQNMPTRHLHLLYIGSIVSPPFDFHHQHKCMHWMESLPQSQVHALMTVAICLVNASLSEGQALTIMEAMALGCPVVARNIPANTDLIQHNETGLIFNSPTELKACLESLLVNEDLYKSISSRAADKMRQQEFQLHTEAMAYLRLVKDIQTMES